MKKNTHTHNTPSDKFPNFDPHSEPINDFSGVLGEPLLKGDVFKIYYLMLLSGVPAWKVSRTMFNLKYAETRATMVQVRNELVNMLRKVLVKAVTDPILYQRLKVLAAGKNLNVFEEIEKELSLQLNENAVSAILKKLMLLKNDKRTSQKLAAEIIHFGEEAMGTGTMINIGGNETPAIAGLPPDQPPVGKNRRFKIIRRRGIK